MNDYLTAHLLAVRAVRRQFSEELRAAPRRSPRRRIAGGPALRVRAALSDALAAASRAVAPPDSCRAGVPVVR